MASVVGCGSAEQGRRDAQMAATVKQVEELRKGQEQMTKDVSKLAGELKALDAQAAFLVGETKASTQEREQLKGALQQHDATLRSLQAAVDETNQRSLRSACRRRQLPRPSRRRHRPVAT